MLGLDFNFYLIKIKSVVLSKGLNYILHRIGWGGLPVAGLLFLGDSGSWCSFMAPSGGEVTPYSGPSGASSSTAPGGKEITQDDLWEELEKQSASKKEVETPVQRNISEENSLYNRIRTLGNKEGVPLLDQQPSEYWGFVKKTLETASSQCEYAASLETESRF